jgi:hypothetical protein
MLTADLIYPKTHINAAEQRKTTGMTMVLSLAKRGFFYAFLEPKGRSGKKPKNTVFLIKLSQLLSQLLSHFCAKKHTFQRAVCSFSGL